MDKNQPARQRGFTPLLKLKSYNFRNYNLKLVFLLILICAIGVAVIGSANGSSDLLSKPILKQGFGVIIGLVGMFIISLIDYNFILKFFGVIYVINVGLLLAVLKFGKNINGATRWIAAPGRLGDYITIQPSEFAKIFLILFFAKLLSLLKEKISTLWFMFLYVILMAVPLLLIVKEPDLSTTILITMLIVVMYFAAGISYKKILLVLSVMIPIVVGMFIYIQQPDQKLLKPYQLNRVLSFIYPDEYDSLRYQQDNAVLAIGSGKLTGKGLYNDAVDSVKNNNQLSKEAVNDFIFAVIGEEMGFVGSVIVLGIMFLIIVECFISAIFAPDLAGRLICTGMAMLLTLQTFINVGVATEILPNTGIPLPFISSGLSSLLALFGGMGFVLNVSLQRQKRN